MPKSERDEILSTLTSRIFSAMVNDLVMDATLQSHHAVIRSRTVCHICNTHCGSIHTSGPSTATQSNIPPSKPGSPASAVDGKVANGSSGTGSNTPTSVRDGQLYLECVNCSRQIASSRYAPHLSTCMGLASARRGAVRGNVKPKHPSEAGPSASPTSDTGNISDESLNTKSKGKSMAKRTDEAEFSLKRKRPGSPQVSPAKKQKKQKISGSAVSRLKANPATSGTRNNIRYSPPASQSKVPSRLRDSSTASFIGGSSTSNSSRDSSPEVASAATPASSSFSRSPNHTVRLPGSNKSIVSPPRRPSPPQPPPIHVPDYNIGVEGDETGSSTDTDSS